MRLSLLADCTTVFLAQELMGDYEIDQAPGYATWMQTCLEPDAMLAFNPELICIILTQNPDPTLLDAALRTLSAKLKPEMQVCLFMADEHIQQDEVLPLITRLPLQIPQVIALPLINQPAYFDLRMAKLTAMPFSLTGITVLANQIRALSRAKQRPPAKVLALDLDNTLWQGVMAEDVTVTPNQVALDVIRKAHATGVILTILSKNNPADITPAWQFLDQKLFAQCAINWQDKSVNLLEQATALNLNPDAFVFVDDNPAERTSLAAKLPSVMVPDWPIDWESLYNRYFLQLNPSQADFSRNASYQAQKERQALQATLTLDDYLASLEIETVVRPAQPSDVARIAQLSVKTHQFALNPRPWTETQILAELKTFWIATTRDRFVDEGTIAFARVANHTLTDFAMSCRAMGRKIEYTIIEHLDFDHVTLTPTDRNQPIQTFLQEANLR